MSSELLHYEDVKFRREGREILKGIHWHIEEGENWALLGLNGAGKSTMLSMIPAYQILLACIKMLQMNNVRRQLN